MNLFDWISKNNIFKKSGSEAADPLNAAMTETGSQQILSRAEREHQPSMENMGPVSRDQLYRDLLKDRQREIHVEDFLWTGSGK